MEATADLRTFNLLFTEYQGRFIRFANTYVRDLAVAEDVVLEAMIYYWERRHTLAPDSNVPAYVLTVIKHKCLNHLEHVRVREATAEMMRDHVQWELSTRISTLEACEPDELFTTDMQEIVDKTLNALPKQTRRIFVMSRYRNMSYKEIAIQCSMTVKGVEFHISKALSALRRSLKDYLPLLGGMVLELLF
ncbi:MAG: RNA polymerase sigma-70 factor [Tannerellaceae bacterium]|jgi:RNA polymerase sigma-70 factor (ECF subfamily)|nr:RNA polymerase sigma-70 factor [Tannerellaceae bacterium]